MGVTVKENVTSCKQSNIAAAKTNRVLEISEKTFSSKDGAMITKL